MSSDSWSVFGLAENCGLIRITCSGHQSELTEMMNRLEHCLFFARKARHNQLVSQVSDGLWQLKQYEKEVYDSLHAKVASYSKDTASTKELKSKNDSLMKALTVINNLLFLHQSQ